MRAADRGPRLPRLGAAAGAAAILVYLVGAAVMPVEPPFGAPAAEVAAYFDEHRSGIQLAAAIQALWAPLLIWFLATARAHAERASDAAGLAATVALGCGVVLVTLFLADVAALAVAALRPDNMAASPELASALRDFSWLAQGMATPAVCAVPASLAAVALRHGALWPAWVGWFGLASALAYALRLGTLFATDGPFAADGVLGLWVPVAAIASWLFLASVVLARGEGAARRV
jgi:hypothetical protein